MLEPAAPFKGAVEHPSDPSEPDAAIVLEPQAIGEFSSEMLRRLSDRHAPFARYQIKGEIARGGQGAVLRVWDGDLRRNLAMKVLLGDADAPSSGATPPVDARSLGRFLEEAQVTGQLDHPGIVPIHELGLDATGRVYFTMKLVKGRTLKEVLEAPPGDESLTRTRVLSLLLKVCEAMAYAHHKKVIHRDLKPSNIMIGRFGEVFVMDWGLAKVLGHEDGKDVRITPQALTVELVSERHQRAGSDTDSPLVTMDGHVVGTPAYMSPEQALGKLEEIGAHSDVYSLGAMIYQLLSGQMPYVKPGAPLNNYAVLYKAQEGPPESLTKLAPDAPAELVAICEKAMARNWRTRYRDMSELAEDLRAFLENRVVAAHRTGALIRARKWVERNRAQAASIAAVVLIALGGLAFYWTRPSGLKVESEPSGASVYVDGALRGTAPLRLDDLRSGDHSVALEHAGFNRLELPVHLARATSRELALRLVSLSGTLYVSTNPPEAGIVLLDPAGNEVQRGTSPLLATLPKGRYRVRAALDLYQPSESDIEVHDDGRLAQVMLRLDPIGSLVMFTAEPEGTLLEFRGKSDDRVQRLVAPFTKDVLMSAGAYEVTASADNCFTKRFTLELAQGARHEGYVSLQPMLSWSVRNSGPPACEPAVGDLDGDGWLDVVTASSTGNIMAVSGRGGRLLWYKDLRPLDLRDVLVHDVDVDGVDEVVVSAGFTGSRHTGAVICLDGTSGSEQWRHDEDNWIDTPVTVLSAGRAGHPELLCASADEWCCLDALDGSKLWSLQQPARTRARLVPVDVESDGEFEVLGTTVTHDRPSGWSMSPTIARCVSARTGEKRWEIQFDDLQLVGDVLAFDLNQDHVKDLVTLARGLVDEPVHYTVVGLSGADGSQLLRVDVPGEENGGAERLLVDPRRRCLYLASSQGLVQLSLASQEFRVLVPGNDLGSISDFSIADTNGDGSLEAVLSSGNSLIAYDLDSGRETWRYASSSRIGPACALADLDADGALECLLAAERGTLECLAGLGLPAAWRARAAGSISVPAGKGDVNGDGFEDALVVDQTAGCRAIDGRDGRVLRTYSLGSLATSTPVVADLDQDGGRDLIVGTAAGEIVAVAVDDGAVKWRVATAAAVRGEAVVADVDLDGDLEVLAGSEDCRLYCIHGGDGTLAWKSSELRGPIRAPVSCATGVGGDEATIFAVLSGTDRRRAMPAANTNFHRFHGRTGELISTGDVYEFEAKVANFDVDVDGRPEVLLTERDEVTCYDGVSAARRWRHTVENRVSNAGDILEIYLTAFLEQARPRCGVVNELGHCELLDAATGRELWRTEAGMRVNTPAMLFDFDRDGTDELALISTEGDLCALDLSDGSIAFTRHLGVGNIGAPGLVLRGADDARGSLMILGSDGVVATVADRIDNPYLTIPGEGDVEAGVAEGRLALTYNRMLLQARGNRKTLPAILLAPLQVPPLFSRYARRLPYWKAAAMLEAATTEAPAPNLRELRRQLEAAVVAAPFEIDAHLALGSCLQRLGETEAAIRMYEELLRAHPDDPGALEAYGKLRLGLGQREAASALVDRLLHAEIGANPHFTTELSTLRKVITDAMRERELEWATLCIERSYEIARWSDIMCLDVVVRALAQGAQPAIDRFMELDWPYLGGETIAALDEYAACFRDPEVPKRVAETLRTYLEERRELVVARVRYSTEAPFGPHPLLPGDRLRSYGKVSPKSLDDLERADKEAVARGELSVDVVVERFGVERHVTVPTGQLRTIRVETAWIRTGPVTELQIALRRARFAYGTQGPLRTEKVGAFASEINWPQCAADFDRVLELDPQADALKDDPRVSDTVTPRAVLCYDAACAHALCASESAGTEPAAAVEAHAKRAVELLEESLKSGWSNWSHMQQDSDLTAIRDRVDMQRLLKQYAPRK